MSPNPEPIPSDPVATLREVGVIAVLRAPSAGTAVRAAEALIAGGVRGIEITYSTPDAAQAIRELCGRFSGTAYVGAGTILSAGQAEEAADAGARFLVTPGAHRPTVSAMVGTGVAVFCGALTPGEVMTAIELGSAAIKIFPASLGGPPYLASLRGPFPATPFLPTGGVTAENLGSWIGAGATAVGAGSELCSVADMAAGSWDAIRQRGSAFARAYRDVRKAVAA